MAETPQDIQKCFFHKLVLEFSFSSKSYVRHPDEKITGTYSAYMLYDVLVVSVKLFSLISLVSFVILLSLVW